MAQNPLHITFSNDTSCDFDVYVSNAETGKVQFTSTLSCKNQEDWCLSFSEDEINDYSKIVCTKVVGSSYTMQDTTKVCALFFQIRARAVEKDKQ